MSKDLTLFKARHLAEQSRAVALRSKQGVAPEVAYAAYREASAEGHADVGFPLPWYTRHMGTLIVGGFASVLAMLSLLIMVVVNGGDEPAPQPASGDIQALVGVVEKLVDADLEEKRLAAEKEKEEKEKKDKENATIQSKLTIVFWLIVIAVFLGLSAQFGGPWGIGVAAFLVLLVFGIMTEIIPLELIELVMKKI